MIIEVFWPSKQNISIIGIDRNFFYDTMYSVLYDLGNHNYNNLITFVLVTYSITVTMHIVTVLIK